MSANSIPNVAQPIAGTARVDPTWFRFFSELERRSRASGIDVSAEIAVLARKLGSPDGTIDGIPDASAASVTANPPILAEFGRVSLSEVAPTLAGELRGIVLDQWGRVTDSRPVVAGAGVQIDGTTNPAQIEIRSTGVTDGDKGDILVSNNGVDWLIDNGVVTYAKMQNVSATDRILGRSTAGAGPVQEIICTAFARTILDDTSAEAVRTTIGAATNPMTTAGDIITGGAAGAPQRLGIGTAGQVLTVVSGAPAWAAAPSGGAVPVQEEGSTVVASPTAINFVGAGVTATASGTVATVTIPGGGGGGSWDTVAVWPSDSSYAAITPPTQVGPPFSFTPDANATYEVEMVLMIASGLTTTAARMGFLWPSGVTRGAVRFSTPTSTTAELVDSLDFPAAANPVATATTAPGPNGSYHIYTMRVIFRTGANPGGNARLTLSTNNGGAVITLSAGSIMRWKKH